MKRSLDSGWIWEKSKNIIAGLCFTLQHVTKFESDLPADLDNPRGRFYGLLYDATKIMCEAVAIFHGDEGGPRWSPDIPQYLYDHPESCEETLKIIESKDFRDQYYEKGFQPETW